MKNHYRYYQRGEKTPWIPVADTDAETEARALGAVRLTILNTSAVISGLETLDVDYAPKDLRFYGPLYFDIDNKDDLAMAIDSANRLIACLVSDFLMEERDITCYLSGSKGVHILIDPENFGLQRSVTHLPKIYREMARQLYVSGLDLQPFSIRNAFRLTNVKREDGNYRVQVTPAELRDLTVPQYRKFCSAPRLDFKLPRKSGKLYTQLNILFEQATDTVKRMEKVQPIDMEVVDTPILRQHFSDEAPPCMQQLADGKRGESVSFNSMAVQVAIFAARLSPDGLGTFRPVFERIADNQKSTEYSKTRVRLEHMEGQYQFMRHTPRYSFSCNAVRSVLKSKACCEQCPIQCSKTVQTPADAAKDIGISSRTDGYFDVTGNKPRRLSTFLIDPQHVFIQHQDNGQVLQIGTSVSINVNGQNLGHTVMNDSAWNNRASFLRSIQGLGNAAFFGNDNDLQRLKYMILSDTDLPEKTATFEMGMHIQKVQGKEVRTYVEHLTSINNLKMNNTFIFEGIENFMPFLLNSGLKVVERGNLAAIQAMKDLFRMHNPDIMGCLLGWASACQLKEHILHAYQQFPLVNIWGNMGSGKTTLARYACLLGGIDLTNMQRELNVPLTTPFAWLNSISNSRTHPVIWDEVNRSGGRMTQIGYAKVVEYLKACFNSQSIQKGTLDKENSSMNKGIAVRTYFAARPVIYCSEQEPDTSPALMERSISLFISKQDLLKNFGYDRKVSANIDAVKSIAYTMMLTALATPAATVREKLDAIINAQPSDLPPRKAYGFAIALYGLAWLEEALISREIMDDELAELMQSCKSAIKEMAKSTAKKLSTQQMSSEVDRVFGALFDILGLSMQAQIGTPGIRSPLVYDVHFQVREPLLGQSYLYLDLRAAHNSYLEWAKNKNIPVILDTVSNFATLAKQEEYVVGIGRDDKVLGGAYFIQVDLNKADARGLPAYYVHRAAGIPTRIKDPDF